jgi:hypothetical protein
VDTTIVLWEVTPRNEGTFPFISHLFDKPKSTFGRSDGSGGVVTQVLANHSQDERELSALWTSPYTM